jgi:uncharacterized phiE125 gp8 family phage protein
MSTPTYGGSPEMVRRGFGSLSGVYSFNTWPSEITVSEGERIYPVGLIEAKAMLPVNTDMHDTLIGLLIAGTTGQVERYIGRDTYPKTRVAQYERPADVLSLPYGPHGAVASVEGIDIDGNATTLTATTDYTVEGIEFKRVRLKSAGYYMIRVTFASGYGAGECPEEIRAAIMQELSLQYKNRQDPNAPARTVVNNLTIEARNLLLSFVRHIL